MNDPDDLQRLGAAIRRYRMSQQLSQDRFADKIEMHRAYYGAIERGAQNITVATLLRVCRGLGVSLSDVFREAAL